MTAVAVVDVGSNSTRLLVCDVAGGRVVAERERRSLVTRLAEGVDATGALSEASMQRVLAAVEGFGPALAQAEVRIAVLTSAVRDAANGAAFAARLAERHGLDARVLPGEEEARLCYVGATSERAQDGGAPTLVVDVGGGSTELIVGAAGDMRAFASLQMGVVRFTERHLHSDPPAPAELRALAEDARSVLAARPQAAVERAIAVAGTPTTIAAIDLALEPYDPARVHGHRVTLARAEELLARLAQMPLAERRAVPGLHPERAPVVLAGVVLLVEVLRAYGLREFEASEHDLLRGAAIAAVP